MDRAANSQVGMKTATAENVDFPKLDVCGLTQSTRGVQTETVSLIRGSYLGCGENAADNQAMRNGFHENAFVQETDICGAPSASPEKGPITVDGRKMNDASGPGMEAGM